MEWLVWWFQQPGRGECAALLQRLLLLDLHVFALLSYENSFKNRADSFLSPKNIKTVATVWSSKENCSHTAVWMPACVFVVITAVSAVNTHSQPFSFDAMLSFLSFMCSERWTVEEKRSWTEVAEVSYSSFWEKNLVPVTLIWIPRLPNSPNFIITVGLLCHQGLEIGSTKMSVFFSLPSWNICSVYFTTYSHVFLFSTSVLTLPCGL